MNNTIILYLTSSAFVLIDCDFPFSENIIEELKKIPEIEEFYKVQSIYDIIAKVLQHNLKTLALTSARKSNNIKLLSSKSSIISETF